MSFLGPVWYSLDGNLRDGDKLFAPLLNRVISPVSRGYMWQPGPADGDKPVVHSKPVSLGGYRPPIVVNGLQLPFYHVASPRYAGWPPGFAEAEKEPASWWSDGNICWSVQLGQTTQYSNSGKVYIAGLIRRWFIFEKDSLPFHREDYSFIYGISERTVKPCFNGEKFNSALRSRLFGFVLETYTSLRDRGSLAKYAKTGYWSLNGSVYSRTVQQILQFLVEQPPVAIPTSAPAPYSSSRKLSGGNTQDLDRSYYLSQLQFGESSIETVGHPILLGSVQNYWLGLLRSKAFVDACESMPRLSDNSISNLTEIVEFLLSVVRREPPKLPVHLNDIWLAYRYQYSTTKMDVKEAWEFINRYYDLGSLNLGITSHGQATEIINGMTVTCRCTVEATPRYQRGLGDLAELWRVLSTYGLAPDLYYLWDSTPFSFIVDWFLPIGDVLAAVDASMLYTNQNYSFSRICYSLSYSPTDSVRCYSRWVENRSPEICPLYWLEQSHGPSAKQVLYRSLDAASLVLGMIK